MKPICCGKPTTPYKKEWKHRPWFFRGRFYYHTSTEEGFRCRQCGRIRIPFESNRQSNYMASLDAVRSEGIAWELINLSQ